MARGLQGIRALNFVNLVTHGLAALSCYSEIIGVRLVMISTFFFIFSLLGIAITLTLRLATNIPLYGWTSLFSGLLVVFLLQVITLGSIFTMQIISARSIQPFLPIRDYVWYVDRVVSCFQRPS